MGRRARAGMQLAGWVRVSPFLRVCLMICATLGLDRREDQERVGGWGDLARSNGYSTNIHTVDSSSSIPARPPVRDQRGGQGVERRVALVGGRQSHDSTCNPAKRAHGNSRSRLADMRHGQTAHAQV
ncbi:hypothetical protein LX36DRAFT_113295 [Colletotrichum falcatum]|nr:hypothetical protein LX36DRAFT_113295 [Colletotrichum falcatum]